MTKTLLDWVLEKTEEDLLSWDFQDTPAGGVFACRDVSGYELVSTPNFFMANRMKTVEVPEPVREYCYEGSHATKIYSGIWKARAGKLPWVIASDEIDGLVADAKESRKRYYEIVRKVGDGEQLDEDEKEYIVTKFIDETYAYWRRE